MRNVYSLLIVLIGWVLFAWPTGSVAGEWEQVLAGAKREGKIVIMGPGGASTRVALTQGFRKKYPWIKVDFSGSRGSQIPPKLLNERRANHYRVDLVIGGTTTMLTGLMRTNTLDPVQPLLVGPNIQPSKWLGGKLDFADNAGKYALVMSSYVKAAIAYNPKIVSEKEVKSWKSWKDFLEPKWKGKMSSRDPSSAGTGQAMFVFWYSTKGLGTEYIKQILAQDVVLSNRDRQLIDWLVRGQYPISLGLSERSALPIMKAGGPLKFLQADELREKFYITAGAGSLGVVNKAPHPNALKVYLNYLLGHEGQLAFSQANGYPSRRADVSREHLTVRKAPTVGVNYQLNYKEPFVDMRGEMIKVVKPMLKR